MSNWNDILSSGADGQQPGKIPEDKVIAYLEGRLSSDEQHEVERWLAEEGMESDALEGLHHMPSAEARQSVKKLNHQLNNRLTNKKRRRRQPITENKWAWVAAIVVLLLGILAYIILYKMTRP